MDVNPAEALQDAPRRRPSPFGFWFLIVLAMIGFIPCVMIPVWDDYQALMAAVGEESQVNEAMRSDIERLERRRIMIETDPAVTLRASRRELGYRRAGDVVVDIPVSPPPPTDSMLAETGTDEVSPPEFLLGFLGSLPPLDYRAVFVEEPSRTVMLAMSGCVLLAAFAIYHGQPSSSARRRLPTFQPDDC